MYRRKGDKKKVIGFIYIQLSFNSDKILTFLSQKLKIEKEKKRESHLLSGFVLLLYIYD